MVLIHCDVGKIDTTLMEQKFVNICQHLDFFFYPLTSICHFKEFDLKK